MITARVLSGRILFVGAMSLVGCGRVGIELGSLDDGGDEYRLDDGGVAYDARVVGLDSNVSPQRDSDGDGVPDTLDGCPSDATKNAPGPCGCNVAVPAGLTAYWTFDETSGTSAIDAVASKVGTLRNFPSKPWTTGQVAGALAFDGIDDEVDLAGVTSQLRGVSFWLKAAAVATTEVQTPWLSPSSFNAGGKWNDPANAFASDNQFTDGGGSNGDSEDFGGFGFSLPSGTAITGIEADVQGFSANPTGSFAIELSWNGGTSHTKTNRSAVMPPVVNTYVPFGNATDLWGRTWSADELSDTNFRVQLSKSGIPGSPMTPGVDHIRVRVNHASIPINRPVVSLSASARIEVAPTTVVASGFPAGTVVYVDGVAGGPVDTGWHHVVVAVPSDVPASQLEVGAASGDRVFYAGIVDDLKLFTVAPTMADLNTLRTNPSCR